MIKKFLKRKVKRNKSIFGKFRLRSKKSMRRKSVRGLLFKFPHITSKNIVLPVAIDKHRIRDVKVPLHSALLNYVQEHNLTKIIGRMDAPYHLI
jgi:hypothetical protein